MLIGSAGFGANKLEVGAGAEDDGAVVPAADVGALSWDFPRFENMPPAGALVEGADVAEAVGLLNKSDPPGATVDGVTVFDWGDWD